MSIQIHTLDNGLRIIHQQDNNNISYCGYFINAGTRDEKIDEYGMAHFVEHMLFKGTKKRKAYHIINRLDNVGGELNAYTNKEETVVYSAFLGEYANRAIELLSDIITNSTFPQKEIDKEVNVIIDEIHSCEDNPSELIYDNFENLIFKNTPLGHNILGEEDTILKFDTKAASNFYKKNYNAENLIFFFLGKTPFKTIVKQLEKVDFSNKSDIFNNKSEQATIIAKGVSETIDKDTNQGHVMIGCEAYNLTDSRKKTSLLLNNILGGPGMSSRLNMQLREKRGYVYSVESMLTPYTDTGIFSIYFGCDLNHIPKCIDLTYKEIKKLKDNKLTESQLHLAKQQMIGQIAIARDNRENIALSLAKNYQHYKTYITFEETISNINMITANDLLEVANHIFQDDKIYKLIYK